MCGKSVYMLCIVTVDGDDGVVEAEGEGEDFMTEIESALSQDRQASNGEWEKLLQAAKSAGTLSNIGCQICRYIVKHRLPDLQVHCQT